MKCWKNNLSQYTYVLPYCWFTNYQWF